MRFVVPAEHSNFPALLRPFGPLKGYYSRHQSSSCTLRSAIARPLAGGRPGPASRSARPAFLPRRHRLGGVPLLAHPRDCRDRCSRGRISSASGRRSVAPHRTCPADRSCSPARHSRLSGAQTNANGLVSTPDRFCIGGPEQKSITASSKKAPDIGGLLAFAAQS